MFDYEVFEETSLERDLARLRRYYRSRGYYDARVLSARVITVDAHHVRVNVLQGKPVRSGAVVGSDCPSTWRGGSRKRLPGTSSTRTSTKGRRDIVRGRRSRYAYAKVKAHADVDIARRTAGVTKWMPGSARYGPVRIVGLTDVPEGPVRDNLGCRRRRYPLYRRRANGPVNLGVFATVDIRQDLTNPIQGVVRSRSWSEAHYGRFDSAAGCVRRRAVDHLTIGWEHRNFFGGMRKFSINTHPGVVSPDPDRQLGRAEPTVVSQLCPSRAPAGFSKPHHRFRRRRIQRLRSSIRTTNRIRTRTCSLP